MFVNSKRAVVRKAVKGEDALIVSKDADYKVLPESVEFEPLLARDISEKNEDFILKGKVVDNIFIATDVVYHGEFLANKSWGDRFLDLKKNFDYKPSVRWSGCIVAQTGEEIIDAMKAYSYSPYFEGVYIEDYDSDMLDNRVFVGENVVDRVGNDG